MSKEMWIRAYEGVTETIMEEKDVEYEEAEEILNKIINEEGDSILSDYWYEMAECWEG